jgi:hypothetical protein
VPLLPTALCWEKFETLAKSPVRLRKHKENTEMKAIRIRAPSTRSPAVLSRYQPAALPRAWLRPEPPLLPGVPHELRDQSDDAPTIGLSHQVHLTKLRGGSFPHARWNPHERITFLVGNNHEEPGSRRKREQILDEEVGS